MSVYCQGVRETARCQYTVKGEGDSKVSLYCKGGDSKVSVYCEGGDSKVSVYCEGGDSKVSVYCEGGGRQQGVSIL